MVATRQKSCVPCANAKRKCDQKDPVCGRCASRLLHCEYKPGSLRRGEGHSSTGRNLDTPVRFSEGSLQLDPEIICEPACPLPATSQLQLARGNEIGAIGSMHNSSFEEDFLGAYDKLVLNSALPEVGTMDRDRLRFCVRQLEHIPVNLVREGKSPFIHLQSYNPIMPHPLQEAWSAAALYLEKTDANEIMVWDIIAAKAAQLVEPHSSWSVSEHLASVQALIIFQIIRLFDGNISQRADAERHNEILLQWTNHLVYRTGILASSCSVIPASWESWVFEEMTCRTIIVSRILQAMFSIQKQGYCTMVAAVAELSFTMQRALWEAPTAMHWQRELREKRRFHALHMDFTETFATGTLEDVDDLGILLLVTFNGVNGVNEWIAKTGSTALIV